MNKLWNEAYSKQAKNLEIIQEDLAQTERINNLKREQLIENSVKAIYIKELILINSNN